MLNFLIEVTMLKKTFLSFLVFSNMHCAMCADNKNNLFDFFELDNGMKVYLHSNPDFSESGVGLSILSGSNNDPREHQGISHLLEHSLFAKSQNSKMNFYSYITKKGGQVNAKTSEGQTKFMFTCPNHSLNKVFETFVDHIIRPDFQDKIISNEIGVVNQEYEGLLMNEGMKAIQILKKENGIFSFTAGNKETLKNVNSKILSDFYDRYYSATGSKLVVFSNKDLTELRNIVTRFFSDFKEGDRLEKKYTAKTRILSGSNKKLEMLSHTNTSFLFWEIQTNIKFEDILLISSIFNSTHEGSLSEVLKRKNLITFINTEVLKKGDKFLLSMQVTLQDKKHEKEFKNILYSFINSLKIKKLPAHFRKEIETTYSDMYFHGKTNNIFQNIEGALYVLEYSDNFPDFYYSIPPFNKSKLNRILNHIKQEEEQSILLTRGGVFLEYETKFKTYYRELYDDFVFEEEDYDFKFFPEKNEYLDRGYIPIIDNKIKDYKKVNDSFIVKKEKTNPFIYAHVKYALSGDLTAKTHVVLSLFKRTILSQLYPEIINSRKALIEFNMLSSNNELMLDLYGIRGKHVRLVEKVLTSFNNLSESHFESEKKNLLKNFEKFYSFPPLKILEDYVNTFVFQKTQRRDQLETLKTLSFDDFKKEVNSILKSSNVKGIIAGNTTSNEINSMIESLSSITENKNLQEDTVSRDSFSDDKVTIDNNQEMNAAIVLRKYPTYSLQESISNKILSKILQNKLFEAIRMKNNVAYSITVRDLEYKDNLYLSFGAQSSIVSSDYLVELFSDFFRSLSISEKEFAAIKNHMIEQSQSNDNLKTRSLDKFNEVFEGKAQKEWYQALHSLDFNDFQVFLDKMKGDASVKIFQNQ